MVIKLIMFKVDLIEIVPADSLTLENPTLTRSMVHGQKIPSGMIELEIIIFNVMLLLLTMTVIGLLHICCQHR